MHPYINSREIELIIIENYTYLKEQTTSNERQQIDNETVLEQSCHLSSASMPHSIQH